MKKEKEVSVYTPYAPRVGFEISLLPLQNRLICIKVFFDDGFVEGAHSAFTDEIHEEGEDPDASDVHQDDEDELGADVVG